MSEREQNKAVAREFFVRLSAGEAERLLELYTEDFTCCTAGSLPFSGTHPRAEIAAMVSGVRTVFPDGLQFAVRTITAEEDRVAVEAESHGKHVSGKVYNQRYTFVLFFRDGKIRELHEYFDTMHANDVLCSARAPGFVD